MGRRSYPLTFVVPVWSPTTMESILTESEEGEH